jgi:hypothetical protein
MGVPAAGCTVRLCSGSVQSGSLNLMHHGQSIMLWRAVKHIANPLSWVIESFSTLLDCSMYFAGSRFLFMCTFLEIPRVALHRVDIVHFCWCFNVWLVGKLSPLFI